VTYLNERARALGGRDAGLAIGSVSASFGIFHLDAMTPFQDEDLALARAVRGATVEGVDTIVRNARWPDGVHVRSNARPIRAKDGAIRGAVVVIHDVTERRRREIALEEQVTLTRERNDAIERLRASVVALSTPILEVWEDVLALPVIGVLDSQRSAEMMERLLAAVEEKQSRFVIIDITGVEVVDSATADRLLKLVRAVEILGARCILTGARGAVAATLVSLGANLGGLVSLRNLKRGIEECLRRMGRAAPPRRGHGAPLSPREQRSQPGGADVRR